MTQPLVPPAPEAGGASARALAAVTVCRPVGRPVYRSCGTTITGHAACWTTWVLTGPIRSRAKPPSGIPGWGSRCCWSGFPAEEISVSSSPAMPLTMTSRGWEHGSN